MGEAEFDATVGYTTKIVSAFVRRNAIASGELTGLIHVVHDALIGLSRQGRPAAPADPPKPAVPIRKSVMQDYLICLEDGKRFKSLKRHLRVNYDMTPEQYRARWRLPPDYPMVAPGYAQRRSEMAKSMGLGQERRTRRRP